MGDVLVASRIVTDASTAHVEGHRATVEAWQMSPRRTKPPPG